MKKLFCLLLTAALMLAAFTAFPATASADTAPKTLTVTCNGQVLGEVEVGSEFIYHVAMNSAGYSITGGEAWVNYDSSYVKVVEYGPVRSNGSVYMSSYSFPTRIINSSLAANFLDTKNQINYNFAKFTGVGAFSESDHYFKVRFKALAAGTVEIRHYANNFYSFDNNKTVRLFHFDKGNDQLDPIPYTICSIELPEAYIGDADGDWQLTIMDATFIQRVTAGYNDDYQLVNADVNADNAVNLKDALAIMRYRAGMDTGTQIGTWIYASEA